MLLTLLERMACAIGKHRWAGWQTYSDRLCHRRMKRACLRCGIRENMIHD